MKKATFILAMAMSSLSYSQYTTAWPTLSAPNGTPANYVGIGTKSTTTSTNTPLPAYNLHLHSTTDYTLPDQPVNGMQQHGNTQGEEKIATPMGKTVRLGLTNSITGITEWDGSVLRASGNDFYIYNQETSGSTNISAYGVGMSFSAANSRIWVGGTQTTAATNARFNIATTDNGLYVQTLAGTDKYGVRIRMKTSTADAIQVFQDNGTTKNFKVTGAGEVFARKYTTTLNTIPDYVFQPDYQLMPLTELRTYVTTNSHLPNVPSAKEFEANGVDLGELNRLLLEKTEELTLYILQLEERISILEESK